MEFERGVRLATRHLRLSRPPPMPKPGPAATTAAQGYLTVLRATVPFTPLSDV